MERRNSLRERSDVQVGETQRMGLEAQNSSLVCQAGSLEEEGQCEHIYGGQWRAYTISVSVQGERRLVLDQGWENYKGLGWLMGGMKGR